MKGSVIMKKLFVILISVLLLVSCTKEEPKGILDMLPDGQSTSSAQQEAEADMSEVTNELPPQSEPLHYSYEYVKEQYPDKTVLTWHMTSMGEDDIPDTDVINKYLSSLNCDFVLAVNPSRYAYGENAYDSILKAIEEGTPPDIISTIEMNRYGSEVSNYPTAVRAGLLEPLDDYLSGTDLGKELVSIFSPEYLKTFTIDGKIYGIDGSFNNVYMTYGYFVNARLADKYGFDITKSILDQLDVLEAVKSGEPNCDIIGPITLSSASLYSRSYCEGICYDPEADIFYSPLDDKGYTETLKMYYELYSLGYVETDFGSKNECFILPSYQRSGKLLYQNSKTVQKICNEHIGYIECYPVFEDDHSIAYTSGTANGVCANSNNKDKAFELLALLYTDPKLNDLFCYGSDITTDEKGCIIPRTNVWSYAFRFPNMLINSPVYNSFGGTCDPVDKRDAYERVKNAVIIPECLGYELSDELRAKQSAVNGIIRDHSFWNYDSYEASISELKAKLDEAGMDKLIEDINAEYAIWKEQRK